MGPVSWQRLITSINFYGILYYACSTPLWLSAYITNFKTEDMTHTQCSYVVIYSRKCVCNSNGKLVCIC